MTCGKDGLDMGIGKVNIRELKEFQRQLEKLQKPDAFLESCAKELAARLLRMVTKRTPVGVYPKGSGKTGGTLRRGWTIGHITKEGNVYKVEVINPVHYAGYVEFGHRTRGGKGWVPGQFMMTISEQELEKIAPKVLERKLMNYLGECLK